MTYEVVAAQGPDVTGAMSTLAQSGILGAICALLFAYAFWATKTANGVRDERVADQKKVTETLLAFTQSMQSVVQGLQGAIDGLTKSIDTMRTSVDAAKASAEATKTALDLAASNAAHAHDALQKSLDARKG